MKQVVFLLAFIFTTQAAKASYIYTYLPQLISEADLIIDGKIIAIDSTHFTVHISNVIKGEFIVDTILIPQFVDWACAGRYAPYKTGQEVIFFLQFNKKEYRIIGGGDEGEVPVFNNNVYYGNGTSWFSSSGTYKFDNIELHAIEFTKLDFIAAIKYYQLNKSKINRFMVFGYTAKKDQPYNTGNKVFDTFFNVLRERSNTKP